MNWRRGDIALAFFATAWSAREAAKLSSQQMQQAIKIRSKFVLSNLGVFLDEHIVDPDFSELFAPEVR